MTNPRVEGVLLVLAARRWTVSFFVLTALAALAVAHGLMTATALMAAPFVLLVANLAAALITHARFRVDLPLLLFHLALLGLVALLVLARLVYLDARVTLTSGSSFEGEPQMLEQGPLHPGRLQALHFVNEGFTEDFYRKGGGKQKVTYNRVRWQDEAGHWHAAQIGDDQPLLLQGYRIYTTRRRGFSPVFQWQPKGGVANPGTVQLSSQADGVYAPTASWNLPGGPEVWVMLESPDMERAQVGLVADLGAQEVPHRLVLRVDQQRFMLAPGESLSLPQGVLTYMQLDTWMGYQISYDPTLPWIMATILLGLGSLIWFYWRRIV